VPHVIAFLKVAEYRLIEEPVGIGNEANLHEYIVRDQPANGLQRPLSKARPPRSTKPTASFPSWHAYS
jgi:hypothetical protein